MDSDKAIDFRLTQLEQAVRNLQFCRRQVLLSEVGHLEKALRIKPTTAELRRQAKDVVAGEREEQPSTKEVAQCDPGEAQATEGGEGC